jgi:N-acetylmuramoyl-L-alanine amidase
MRNAPGNSPISPAARRAVSAILFAVQRVLFNAIFLLAAWAAMPRMISLLAAQQEAAPQQPAAPALPSASAQQAPPALPQQPAPEVHVGPLIVLDPAHGGMDTGARGAPGIEEKNIVLLFARIARMELEREGFRVVMTRNDDSDPSYDDRDAVANAHRDVIYISLHVSSTGPFGTARAYSYQFPATTSAAPSGPPVWEEAQRPHADASHRLADFVQGQLAQRFSGSPKLSETAAVRELRSAACPAVAVEISSVSVNDANLLAALAPPLASSIGHGLAAYRAASQPPGPSGQ